MNTYETLIYLATEPFEKNIQLRDDLKSPEAILNKLNEEFASNYLFTIDTKQACETAVYTH